MDNKDVNNIVREIKDIDNNVTGVLVPILKDTITDYRKIVFKLIIVIVVLILSLVALGVTSQIIIAKQVQKYNDFLSQFDFSGSDSYTQAIDADNSSNPIVNDGITVNTK